MRVISLLARQGGSFPAGAVLAGLLGLCAPLSVAAAEDCSASTEALATGQAVASASCKLCHGMEGRGNPEARPLGQARMPHLAGQRLTYLTKAMSGYAKGFQWQEDPDSVFFTEGMRIDENMGQIAANLSDGEVDAVSFWYHCQN